MPKLRSHSLAAAATTTALVTFNADAKAVSVVGTGASVAARTATIGYGGSVIGLAVFVDGDAESLRRPNSFDDAPVAGCQRLTTLWS